MFRVDAESVDDLACKTGVSKLPQGATIALTEFAPVIVAFSPSPLTVIKVEIVAVGASASSDCITSIASLTSAAASSLVPLNIAAYGCLVGVPAPIPANLNKPTFCAAERRLSVI